MKKTSTSHAVHQVAFARNPDFFTVLLANDLCATKWSGQYFFVLTTIFVVEFSTA